jgi:NAD(P)H-flavin reductase/hemoglobin-like flavoprotein
MPGGRHLHQTQEADDSGEPISHSGLLAWWQRRSWRMDLAVLARVRDGLNRLDEEPGLDNQVSRPPADTAHTASVWDAKAGTAPVEAGVGTALPSPVAPRTHAPPATPATPASSTAHATPASPAAAGGGVLPDPAIASIRETFAIVAAAGEEPASYFYARLFVAHPSLRSMFPPAMDVQRDRLLGALVRIVEGLTSPEDLVRYLSQLGHDHRKYAVEPAMYGAVGEALIATLRAYAGPAFTSAAEEAWTQAYQAASGLMIRAAEEDSANAPAFWRAEVVSNEQRRPGIAVVTVAPHQALPYLAGQHITVQTPRWPRVWRSYSIASTPREDGLMTLHVRAVPGGWVSNALVRYTAPGDEIILGPALGTMTLDRAGQRDLLCVAGGTGLAPIKAIVEQAIRESSAWPRQIFLFYGARTREELYDLPDLYRLTDAYPRFLLTPVTSDDPAFDGMQGNVGRVAARYLPHHECEAYVAGPAVMVRETIAMLARAGIPQDRIHYDDALLATDRRMRPSQAQPAQAASQPQPAPLAHSPQPDPQAQPTPLAPPALDETNQSGDAGDAGAMEMAAERALRDSEELDEERSQDEPPEREQVSAGVLAAQHNVMPG